MPGSTRDFERARERLNRERQIDADDRRRLFLAAYEQHGTVSKACSMAGISRSTQRNWMQDQDFVDLFEQSRRAFAEHLEGIALERVKDPSGSRGSDVLLMGLLNANWPQKYRPAAMLDQDYAREVLGEMKRVFKQQKADQPEDAKTELSVPMERTLAQILEKRGNPKKGKADD